MPIQNLSNMEKKFSFALLCLALGLQAQNQLNVYSPTPDAPYPSGMVKLNPSVIPPTGKWETGNCGALGTYAVGQNNDFTVQVKKADQPDSQYVNLFEYNTFVNSGQGTLMGVTRSSFVTFDYLGDVVVRITCNQFASLSASQVVIRPQSRGIPVDISGNVITIPLHNSAADGYSDKLSVELNGNRYSNLQIFANKIYEPLAPVPTFNVTYEAANNGTALNDYSVSLNNVSKKIIIKQGAIVKVPYTGPKYTDANGKINMLTGDEIYFEGGAVLNGGIIAKNVQDIRIYGRGIIDLTNYPKQYDHDNPNEYAYTQPITLRWCKNVTLDGLIINDSQQLCVEMTDCGGTSSDLVDNMKINNLKMFSRALWGDGFHMRGTSNVLINDCYNRTSDDAISIYASRHQGWDSCNPSVYPDPLYPPVCGGCPAYPASIPCDPLSTAPYLNRDALNISVTNTLLYADNAHAIEIGWHGNQLYNNGLNIYNLRFTNINILEHDQNWVQQNGYIHTEYDGAIGINCSDDNKCGNFLFKDVYVEDFTNGSLMTVRTMPYGYGDAIRSGKTIQDVRFENLYYTGTGERKSIIQGIDCERFVNGVHFENFNVRTSPSSAYTRVTSLAGYAVGGVSMFDTNSYAYNITFDEANNYGTALTSGTYYTIRNTSTLNYLKSNSSGYVTSGAGSLPLTADCVWKLVLVGGHYRLHPYGSDALTLENTFTASNDPYCQGRYLSKITDDPVKTNQEWKIKGTGTANTYMINNAYTRAYLTAYSVTGTNTIAFPKNGLSTQKWLIMPYTGTLPRPAAPVTTPIREKITVLPNPAKDYLHVDMGQKTAAMFSLVDLRGSRSVTQKLTDAVTDVYIGDVTDGIYLVVIENAEGVIYSEKFVKTH